MVRESVLRVHYDGDWWRHLALTLLRIGGESDVAGRLLKRAQPDGGILIPYSGPPAHTRTVSYLSVLRGDLPANATRQVCAGRRLGHRPERHLSDAGVP